VACFCKTDEKVFGGYFNVNGIGWIFGYSDRLATQGTFIAR
jgi:hypothetical protein